MEANAMQTAIEVAMLQMLAERGAGKTICPSEVARQLSPDDWRRLMPRIREVAADLQAARKATVTQRGTAVHPLTANGPIRIGLPPSE